MAKSFFFFFLVLSLCVLSAQSRRLRDIERENCQNLVHNVVDYGAVGDGNTDDTKAFLHAWKATCESSCASTMYIPYGKTFLLQPLTFKGKNCQAINITFQVEGTIKAPSKPDAWKCDRKRCKSWIKFEHVNGLFMQGFGTIDAQGSQWWRRHHSCNHNDSKRLCGRKPTGLVVSQCQSVHFNQLTFKDSPQMHIAFERSTWVYVTGLTIQAPGTSPNTDGIHLQHAKNVYINDSVIGTGDDCVSIGDGSSHISITNVACGPGHGISIGSLGKNGKEETVEHVHVSNVSFTGTQNGARIKTWQGGRGYARHINFENIFIDGSSNPIIIDQFYCDHTRCTDHDDAVYIDDVTYDTIYGTSHKKTAVHLACSESVPCTNIVMKNVNLQTEDGDEASSYCSNVRGRTKGTVSPLVPCLS